MASKILSITLQYRNILATRSTQSVARFEYCTCGRAHYGRAGQADDGRADRRYGICVLEGDRLFRSE